MSCAMNEWIAEINSENLQCKVPVVSNLIVGRWCKERGT